MDWVWPISVVADGAKDQLMKNLVFWCSLLRVVPLAAAACSSGEASHMPSAAGTSGTAGRGAAAGPDESLSFAWTACGTIPSTEFRGFPNPEPGSTVVGGHPRPPQGDTVRTPITSLAMSADGKTLASMGGVLLAWEVAPAFADSRATYISSAAAERPTVDVSPDGRWLAVSGDGRFVLSRFSGHRAVLADGYPPREACFPIGFRFSPDGQWLAGPGWSGSLDVFRTADIEAALADASLTPAAAFALPSSCGPRPSNSTTRVASRAAFTPDGETLLTETGFRYRAPDFQLVAAGSGDPQLHGLRGGFEVSPRGDVLRSDCGQSSRSEGCAPLGAPFPKFSPDGKWFIAGGTLSHVDTSENRVLDATALVGIFAPNGDVIAAAADNTLTRYCRSTL